MRYTHDGACVSRDEIDDCQICSSDHRRTLGTACLTVKMSADGLPREASEAAEEEAQAEEVCEDERRQERVAQQHCSKEEAHKEDHLGV